MDRTLRAGCVDDRVVGLSQKDRVNVRRSVRNDDARIYYKHFILTGFLLNVIDRTR